MPQSPSEPLGRFTQQVADYLPTLTAGAVLLACVYRATAAEGVGRLVEGLKALV